jgi:hypothetical protein
LGVGFGEEGLQAVLTACRERGAGVCLYRFLLWRKPYKFLWLLRNLIGLVARLALESF